jgi:hypothetical protein
MRTLGPQNSVSGSFGGGGGITGNAYGLLQYAALHRHFGDLFLHRSHLAKHNFALSAHFLDLMIDRSHRADSRYNARDADEYQCEAGDILREKQFVQIAWRLGGMVAFLPLGCLLI